MKIFKWILFFLMNITIITSIVFFESSFWLILACLLWGNILLYTIFDLDNRSVLFTFIISFFVFLMGRQILERIFNHEVRLYFSEEFNIHAEKSLVISLVCLIIGYFVGKKIKLLNTKKERNNTVNYNSPNYIRVRNVSKYIFYFTYILLMITIIDVALFVYNNGYLDYYTEFAPHVPYLVQKIGDMAPVSFYVFLATMPSKKQTKLPMALYVLYLICTLATGKRFTFVVGLLVVFVYLILRNKINNDGEKWFGKKEAIFSIVAAPALMIFLYIVNIMRFGDTTVSGITLFDSIIEFIYSQGVSINVIKQGVLYEGELPTDRYYAFGTIIRFIQSNFISSLFGVQGYSGNNIEHALYGSSFQHALSYIHMESAYLAGRGLGSSYIAEVYHSFGYFGIAMVNVIYGFVISKLYNFKNKGIWIVALSFLVLESLLFAPRGTADAFIGEFIDITTWGTFIIIYIISKIKFNEKNVLYTK